MRDPILVATGVSRSLETPSGPRMVLAPTSFELRPGELVVVAGPSGSGKTTLCNIVAGWERADAGDVTWHTDRTGWQRLALAPQRLALLPHLSVRENILLPSWTIDPPNEVDLDGLAGDFAIEDLLDRLPNEISFGEQQRVVIARALSARPALALLDEPTGHQDEHRTQIVVDALLHARIDGTCVLAASHDPLLIDAADRVVTLRPVASAQRHADAPPQTSPT